MWCVKCPQTSRGRCSLCRGGARSVGRRGGAIVSRTSASDFREVSRNWRSETPRPRPAPCYAIYTPNTNILSF